MPPNKQQNQEQDPARFRSLGMWMQPPSAGWKEKRRKKGSGLSRPLGVLAVILVLVGFSGLMIVRHATDTGLLFKGIGDLHRQAAYISELSTPPVAPPRLRYVLEEFENSLRALRQELDRPLLIAGFPVPWGGTPARTALEELDRRWQTVYSPTLTKALDTVGMSASLSVQQSAEALGQEIDATARRMENVSLSGASNLFLVQVALLMAGAMVTIALLMRVQHQLLDPMAHLRNWATRMRSGNLAARVPIPDKGEFAILAEDVNALSDALQSLARRQEREVQDQREQLSQQSRSLSTLYSLAESLTDLEDIDDHISRFMRVLGDIVGAKAGLARLRTDDDQMRLVSSMGLDGDVVDKQKLVSMEQCLCDDDLISTELSRHQDFEHHTGLHIDQVLPGIAKEEALIMTVPMLYQDRTLGVYNLFLLKSSLGDWVEVRDLLTSIGHQLGMAIHQSKLAQQGKRVSIIQERAMLAHELHDSLAQVLASLGFQARMLEDSLNNQGDNASAPEQARQDLGKLRAGIDTANKELRQLLVHFRASMDERGLIPSLEQLIERFQEETGIRAYFHRECSDVVLTADQEIQVLHIIQEALTNTRKHSQAQTVRVLFSCDPDGNYRILVEDDGKGLDETKTAPGTGEQLGLSIMQERSQHLSGTLQIDSDPGEGTRIELRFAHTPA